MNDHSGSIDGKKAIHIQITGRVQGVGFRAFVNRQANALGLSGWVRNTRFGTVEALISGPVETVERMLEVCRRGPDWARVEALEILGDGEVVSGQFEIRSTE